MLYFSVQLIKFIHSLLPDNLILLSAKIWSNIFYFLDIKGRKRIFHNLKHCQAADFSDKELRDIRKSFYHHFVLSFLETITMSKARIEHRLSKVQVEGKEHVDEALKEKKGAILLTLHFGNWEVSNLKAGTLGFPYSVFVKTQSKSPALNALLNNIRSLTGAEIITRGQNRELIQAFKDNRVVAMVMDQGGEKGIRIPFLGKECSFAQGALKIALKHQVPIIPSIIVRENGFSHRLIGLNPIHVQQTEFSEESLKALATQVVTSFERFILTHPEQYFWRYKIWKYTKLKNLVILDDGRTGHLRQSERMTSELTYLLREKGLNPNIQTVPVSFKNEEAKKKFQFNIAKCQFFIEEGFLKKYADFFTEECYAKLCKLAPDFIVSTGSSTAGLNWLLKTETGAKSIVIQRSFPILSRYFDLHFMLYHDQKKPSHAKQQIIDIAPNLIQTDYLVEMKNSLFAKFPMIQKTTRPMIGVLIGGNIKTHHYTEHFYRKLIQHLQTLIDEYHYFLLITTSRRTAKNVEKMFIQFKKKNHNNVFLVVENVESVKEAVGGFLALSDIHLVTADSISMISESVSAHGKTIVMLPDVFDEGCKHHFFLNRLLKKNFLVATKLNRLPEMFSKSRNQKIAFQQYDQSSILRNELHKII